MPWTWDSSFEIGVKELDDQHKQIVSFTDKLEEAIENDDKELVWQVLDELALYASTHFPYEEDLMAQAEYPLLESHRKVHEHFKEKIEKFKVRFANGENIAKKLLSELGIWLTNHIKYVDQAYAPHVVKMLNEKDKKTKQKGNWFTTFRLK